MTLPRQPTRRAPVFGAPFSEKLDFYHRLDVRVEKKARYGFGDVLYYVDILNVTDQTNVANRNFPLRNTVFLPPGADQASATGATILPDDEEQIPLFIAFRGQFFILGCYYAQT